jgi:hypothetical protein
MQADRQPAEAMQVGHALIMLAELPDHSANAAYPIAVRAACLESFYSICGSCRIPHRQTQGPETQGPAYNTANDYLRGWTRPPTPRPRPFGRSTGFASEQVSHLVRSRVSGRRWAQHHGAAARR